MKIKIVALSLLSTFTFLTSSNAADEPKQSSGKSELCLYAGHYLQKQNGVCPKPPQGSCAPSQVECNRLMFNPVCVAATSNPAGTSSQCRDLSNAQGYSFLKEFSADQKAAFDKLHESARAYFVQERDRAGQRGISRKRASKENVEADVIYTRYMNLTSIVSANSFVAQAPPAPAPASATVNATPAPSSTQACVGPSASDFNQCDDQVKAAITEQLSGSCQLILMKAESRKSEAGVLQTYQWDSATKKFSAVGGNAMTVKFGKGGLAYGNRYFSLAPRKEHRIESGRGQTPIGVYSGLIPVSDSIKDFRCVTDPGSQYFNAITTRDNNIGKSTYDDLQYKYALMLRYPASNLSKKRERNAACLLVHSTTGQSCTSRGCMSMEPSDLDALKNWIDFTKRPAVAILPENELKNLSSCLPGLGPSQVNKSINNSEKSKARQ